MPNSNLELDEKLNEIDRKIMVALQRVTKRSYARI